MFQSFKNILYRITSTTFRRNFGVILNKWLALLLKFPFIGKAIWRNRIKRLEEKPQQVTIELTAACNAKCIMCPRHNMDRAMTVMDFGLFKKIIHRLPKESLRALLYQEYFYHFNYFKTGGKAPEGMNKKLMKYAQQRADYEDVIEPFKNEIEGFHRHGPAWWKKGANFSILPIPVLPEGVAINFN